MSWQDAWREGRTRWDAGQSPPVLGELVTSGTLPAGRALVPGCGSGYDLLALAAEDRNVVGLDLAELAAQRFDALKLEHPHGERTTYVVGDFFEFRPEQPFNLIFDYTFLCALEPAMRTRWAERMDELLADDGEIVTLIFPVHPVPMNPGGPPYPMTPELVTGLLASRFATTYLEPVQRSHSGREGKEWLGRFRRR